MTVKTDIFWMVYARNRWCKKWGRVLLPIPCGKWVTHNGNPWKILKICSFPIFSQEIEIPSIVFYTECAPDPDEKLYKDFCNYVAEVYPTTLALNGIEF